jgi:hypothetical protein
MTSDIRKVVDQVFRLVYVARNVAGYRSLEPFKDEVNQNYWILISNNFFDIAVLEWCKVFGSKGEATHWSSHVKDPDAFRAGLLARLSMSEADWVIYWEKIKSYRDQFVAHHDPKLANSAYPDLTPALSACFFYYEILIRELHLLKVFDYPDSLEEYFYNARSQFNEFSAIAYGSTKALKDHEH